MSGQRYEVRVRGRVGEEALDALPGFDVTVQPVESVLHGPVRDRTDLTTLVATLADLGFEVVELRELPSE